MRCIKLCDSTLSQGESLITAGFRESRIPLIEILSKSKIDIIDLGLFSSKTHTKGLDSLCSETFVCNSDSEYSIVVSALDCPSLEQMELPANNIFGTVRVLVGKSNFDVGMQYCTELKKRGYAVHVVLSNAGEYSSQAFEGILYQIIAKQPEAVYIDDCYGILSTSKLMDYVCTANQILPANIALGISLSNNMLNSFSIIPDVIHAVPDRDIIVNASLCGMAPYAGTTQTEIIAIYLNQQFGSDYDSLALSTAVSKYISKYYGQAKYGFSNGKMLSALTNCHSEYGEYLEDMLHLPPTIIGEVLSNIPQDSRFVFDAKTADQCLRQCCISKFRVAIVVPTKNKPDVVKFWIKALGDLLYKYGIDLIFYDGSEDDSSKEIIEKFNSAHILWRPYRDIPGDITLDNKVYSAAKLVCAEYDYIWICRDRSIPQIPVVYQYIYEMYANQYDFSVVFPHVKSPSEYGKKIYTDCCALLRDLCGEMTSLGSIIFSQKIMVNLVESCPVDKMKNYGLWLPIALFDYIADIDFRALYFVDNSFFHLPYNSSSFWIKSDTMYWLWGKRWIEMIDRLPAKYDEVREDILKFKGWSLPPFSKYLLMHGRANGGLRLKTLLKNWKYVRRTSDIPMYKLLMVSLIPCKALSFYNSHYNSFFIRFPRSILKKLIRPLASGLKRFALSVKNIVTPCSCLPYSGRDYGVITDNFQKKADIPSSLLWGDRKLHENVLITIAIPTNGRGDLFQEALDSALNQEEVPFKWNIIVVDNNPDSKEILNIINKVNNPRILYYQNRQNLGVCGNFNRCFELADGKWVTLLHDDDLLTSDYLKRIYRKIETAANGSQKELAYISTLPHYVYQTSQKTDAIKQSKIIHDYIYSYENDEEKLYILSKTDFAVTGDTGITAPTAGTLMNKRIFIEYGGYNEENGLLADQILAYNMMDKYLVCQTRKPMGYYRWFVNESIDKLPEIERAAYDFREYAYRRNIISRVAGFLFKQQHFYDEISALSTVCAQIGQKTDEEKYNKILRYQYNVLRAKLYHITVRIYKKITDNRAIKLIDKRRI